MTISFRPIITWLPLLLLPSLAMLFRETVPDWGFMWLFAFAIYAGCKWLTYATARRKISARSLGYLLAWPGMDAAAFLGDHTPVIKPRPIDWIFAVAKLLFGVALFFFGARLALPHHALLGGWVGMTGLIFILHFGLFHLLALGWQAAGVNATPLMRNPARSTSLGEFWGQRWNTAFHELVHRYTFRWLARRMGAAGATLAVFLLSGLVHDLVISLPARGGWGLPTLYFLIQGLGVLCEHAVPGRRLGLGHGVRGWLFMLVVTASPAVLLFHPPFVHHIILPMLRAFGAI